MPHPVPDTTLSPVNDRLRAIAERKAQLEAAKKTREAAAALPPSPEDALRAEEEQLARMEREEADEAAWQSALVKHGKGRVGRIRTVEGSIIVRTLTLAESDASGHRIGAAQDSATKTMIGRECTLDVVVYPARDRVRAMCEARPLLWMKLYEVRDALALGEEDALAGKA